jgi:hypothetical protein
MDFDEHQNKATDLLRFYKTTPKKWIVRYAEFRQTNTGC